MDIEEYKKLARNKIEADALTQQVRDVIKITKWQKQDMREGFKETFKPLIKSQDSIKKSIDEQQNATIAQLQANQLALTQGLNQNRLAITQGLENLKYQPIEGQDEEQAEEQDEEQAEGKAEGKAEEQAEGKAKKEVLFDAINYFNKYLNNKERREILNNYGYENLPSYFLEKDINEIQKILNDVNDQLFSLQFDLKNNGEMYINTEGYRLFKPKSKNPQKKTLVNIEDYNALSTYSKNLSEIYNYKKNIKTGTGITLFKNPHQLLDRLELLGGSILAGNNGVLQEFSQIAHLLNQMKVITKKQLNELLKTYITNR